MRQLRARCGSLPGRRLETIYEETPIGQRALEVGIAGVAVPEAVQAEVYRIVNDLSVPVDLVVHGRRGRGMPGWRERFEHAAVTKALPDGVRAYPVQGGYVLAVGDGPSPTASDAARQFPRFVGRTTLFVDPARPGRAIVSAVRRCPARSEIS
jgi:hypothetical protein